MSILPYQRTQDQSTGLEGLSSSDDAVLGGYKMVTSPYEAQQLSSSTDNSSNSSLNTNAINTWYRYPVHVGYDDPNYTSIFSKESVDWMSGQISLLLGGVHPEGKTIIVPDESILSVTDSWYQGTQYTLDMLQEMVIMHIVEQIKNDFQITTQNNKLSAWVMKYDITTGLKRMNGIKLNEKRGTPFYSWNY